MKADLLVLDGRHLLWRTTDAFKDLTVDLDGVTIPTGGVYGFLSCAIRVHARYGGRVAVAWEGRNNFRLKLYPKYKGKDQPLDPERAEVISEMTAQERLLIKLLRSVGVTQLRGKGCEADDVIGRLAHEASARGESVVLYSGDSDLRQLVSERVLAVAPVVGAGARSDTVYDAEAVMARHGVPPRLLAQLKALAGDASDKIPGARGIGPKTAAALLNNYGGLKAVLNAAVNQDPQWPETPRRRAIISDAAADVRTFYQLTKIRTDMPWTTIPPAASQRDVVETMRLLKFRSLSAPAELHAIMRLGK